MEHLLAPENPYKVVEVPYLGLMYSPKDVNARFEDYPRHQGWDLDADKIVLNNYKNLESLYHSVSISHALEFFESILEHSASTLAISELKVLIEGISLLKDSLIPLSGSGPERIRFIWLTGSLGQGVAASDLTIRELRRQKCSREELIAALRKRRLLDLIAVFTDDALANDKALFKSRRGNQVGLLADCAEYEWAPWMLEVKNSARCLQSWLFFGYLHGKILRTRDQRQSYRLCRREHEVHHNRAVVRLPTSSHKEDVRTRRASSAGPLM